MDPKRDPSQICVVEQPRDVMSLEAAGAYRGLYHVLLGRIAPLEGVGPDQLTLDALVERVQNGRSKRGDYGDESDGRRRRHGVAHFELVGGIPSPRSLVGSWNYNRQHFGAYEQRDPGRRPESGRQKFCFPGPETNGRFLIKRTTSDVFRNSQEANSGKLTVAMRLSLGLETRQVQVQKLAPRMIQSMEILQLPIMALQERIEQEMNENPVLELDESDPTLPDEPADRENPDAPADSEREIVVDENARQRRRFRTTVEHGQRGPRTLRRSSATLVVANGGRGRTQAGRDGQRGRSSRFAE